MMSYFQTMKSYRCWRQAEADSVYLRIPVQPDLVALLLYCMHTPATSFANAAIMHIMGSYPDEG